MSVFFLDSSALVKRYVHETGSAWVQSITSPSAGYKIVIARITWVEVLSALARRQREGNLSTHYTTRAIQTFQYDLETQYLVIEVDQAVAIVAGDLVSRHPLRAYDAVQLAAALRIHAALQAPALLTFLSADTRQVFAASAEGVTSDNPNNYP